VIASLVPNPPAMLGLWLAGRILAFAGAITYAELAKICPDAGGEYNYLAQAFGPLGGFLTGWTSLIAGFSGAIAATARLH
jgi:basic amino acid/polyamine antiporter, APA family